MTLRERIEQDLKDAMRARDEVRLNVLRQLKTVIRNKEVELCAPCDETSIVKLVGNLIKQRHDSIEQFGRGGRSDLVQKEETELRVLESYAPQAMNDDEINTLISEVIAAEGASGLKDMGRVIKAVLAQAGGRADGKVVSERVKARLSS